MLFFFLGANAVEYSELAILNEIIRGLVNGVVLLAQRLTVALIVFVIASWVIKWIRKGVGRFLSHRKIDPTVRDFLDNVVHIILKIILFLSIIHIIGISTTSFTAILAAAGLAVGMAMKDNLSNFAGGVMLLVNKPFKMGDRILAQSIDGEVKSIGILYTTIVTADNRTVYIPNGPLSTGTISNYSRQTTRRIDRTLSMKHGVDIDSTKEVLKNIFASDKRILQTPVPFIGVTNLTTVTVDVSIRVWVQFEDYDDVSVHLSEVIYEKLLEKGVYKA